MIENFDIFFNDFGVDCSSIGQGGAFNFKGIFQCPDGLFANDMVVSAKNSVIVKTTDANQIIGNAITINGVSYKMNYRKKIDDGNLTQIEIGK